jgi:hypothetical protein
MRLILKLFLIVIFPAFMIGQGNYNVENYGNRSLLLSGNVTGSVEDLGLTYYNPARIALVENPVFSVNARGFQLNNFAIENAFGADKKLSSSRFEGVPSMLAGTFKIKSLEDHHFAYSFISRRRSNIDIRYSNEALTENLDEVDGLERFVADVNLKNRETDEWFGVTWGKLLTENFSIGVSGFVSIYNIRGSNDLTYAALDEIQDVSTYHNEISFGQSSYGMYWKMGLAWKLPKFDLGFNIDLPYLEVISSGRFLYQEFLSGLGNGNDIFKYAKFKDIKATKKEPLALSVGAGVPMGKHTLHLKIDWHNKVDEYDRLVIPGFEDDTGELRSFAFKEELRSVVNFGVGTEFYINPKYSLYGSFSTDFSAVKTNANIFDLIGDNRKDVNLAVDYIHLGFGVDMNFSWAKMVFGTTFSTGSTNFDQPIDFPNPDKNIVNNNDVAKITYTRWRAIVGMEIPIFGYKVDIK